MLSSYLRNRQQCCKVNGTKSNVENITCGVSQESCLGPPLFLLYVSDLPCVSKCLKATTYADDTSLANSVKAIKDNQCYGQ